ncbi:MAG: energy-coupling factor transporter transmembrane protein EcfT [Micrococcales bacterium]|nr:energy-coupling factor transporter transmembrane protein EcfT [Micrococcales bacterium]
MTLLTDAQPRPGLLRSVPAPVKLAGLVVLGVVSAVSTSPTLLALIGATGGLALVVARPHWRRLTGLMVVWAIALVVVVILQLVTRDSAAAVVSGARMVALCLPALAVMASTAPEELLDTLFAATRPLRRVGLRPEVLALTVALTLRFVPELVRQIETLREAQRARGARPSVLPVTVPLLVRCLDRSRTLADAIVARSFFDRATPLDHAPPASVNREGASAHATSSTAASATPHASRPLVLNTPRPHAGRRPSEESWKT